jgi:uncharacterized protein
MSLLFRLVLLLTAATPLMACRSSPELVARCKTNQECTPAEYERQCEANDPRACEQLAVLHLLGSGVPQDRREAARFFEIACKFGRLESCVGLAEQFHAGGVLQGDLVRAKQLYSKACDGGLLLGCIGVGILAEEGLTETPNLTYALSQYQRACDKGAAPGCTRLGRLYLRGLGVPQDADRAEQMFQKACELQPAECFVIGRHFVEGLLGFEEDRARGVRYWLFACKHGRLAACGWLGVAMAQGIGLPQDLAGAQKIMRESCDAGDQLSCRRLTQPIQLWGM